MSASRNRSVRIAIVAAAGLVVVLAGALAARLLGWNGAAAYAMQAPPAATVPAPRPCDLTKLELPCWGCPMAAEQSLRYRTDLDMLAPLGTGTANAATWFAAFAKPNGPRFAEAAAAMARRVAHGPLRIAPNGLDVLPPNDPLLAEAAPWCDQATMRFYPDIFPVRGGDTQLPNNLLTLNLARSWIARGHDAANFDDAIADFRRVIRLGRLLRQDDVVVIDDVMGFSYIRWGAEEIYDRARKEGKTDLALLAAVVAGEGAPQRYLTAARLTSIEIAPYLRKAGAGSYELQLPAECYKAITEMATSSPDRRFRDEAIFRLQFVAALGAGPMRADAHALLEKLASGPDPIVAANARWSLATPVSDKDVKGLLGQSQNQ
ncbi:MAG: hypothetical protein B7X11_00195 [Acidobacteria bacterium 37-65-4]|nr:MAG: hypothetical protein B7X11_00195 [Acidobacteria bacterium 37-65-4]HQT94128.1 hypothetical protein [Thermoanaerobaculaceae bacterium]HQU33417.1 hypothetical protein [Thermoanaerobaculaceae bacterium]